MFVAIDLPEAVKATIQRFQERLRGQAGPAGGAAKWVDPAGIHLTLAFLGNVERARVGDIAAALESAVAASAPFTISTGMGGGFPTSERPRLLWLGLIGDLERLHALQERVVTALEPLGFRREKRSFSPHLTLARLRDGAAATDVQQLARALRSLKAPAPQDVPVDEVVLMRSELHPAGARYRRLEAARLGR